MQPLDFFRNRIDAMINLTDPLAVLATRLPWSQIETAISTKFERQNRTGQILKDQDMFGTTETLTGAGRSNAGRPKLATRLMTSLLYLKHSFNLSGRGKKSSSHKQLIPVKDIWLYPLRKNFITVLCQ